MPPSPSNSSQEKSLWIEIHDSEISSEQLQAQISERTKQRRARLGRIDQHFPTFGNITDYPDPPTDISYSPNLYYHLLELNRSEPADTGLVLADSISTRLPIVGGLWQMIRREAHNLIRFYVNKVAAHASIDTNHIVNILNELTRITQEQQRAIKELQGEIDSLKRNEVPSSDE